MILDLFNLGILRASNLSLLYYYLCVVTAGPPEDGVVQLGHLGGLDQLLLGGVEVAVGNVVPDGVVQQDSVL